jgi:hypothetical protein
MESLHRDGRHVYHIVNINYSGCDGVIGNPLLTKPSEIPNPKKLTSDQDYGVYTIKYYKIYWR